MVKFIKPFRPVDKTSTYGLNSLNLFGNWTKYLRMAITHLTFLASGQNIYVWQKFIKSFWQVDKKTTYGQDSLKRFGQLTKYERMAKII